MQNAHPTMAAFLAPFAPSYYTLHPDLDAARWEADQDARADREEAERAERLEVLACGFIHALATGAPLPVQAIGADLESLICERADLVAKLIAYAARNRATQPDLRDLIDPIADAWAKEVESLS